uniref:Uncharacterized protein n=1 Tax=Solanum lycopersicum TaxID=4081 RepID=A0A3Q7JC03_SOLLC
MASAYLSMGEAHRCITDFLNHFSDVVSSQDTKSLCLIFSISSNSSFHLFSSLYSMRSSLSRMLEE